MPFSSRYVKARPVKSARSIKPGGAVQRILLAMRTATQRDYQTRILRVLVHIQDHLDHAIDLEALATLASFSPSHFHRIVRGMVGEPVMEHVRRLRLERAAHQLKTSGRPVTQIAFDAGYETHEAFSRAFRARFDESPSKFRGVHRRVPVPGVPSGVHYEPDGGVGSFRPLEDELETMEARVEYAPPLRVAFMRHTGPYDQVGATWQTFIGWAMSRGLLRPGSRLLAVAHDDPEITPPDKLRYDACLAVDEAVQPEASVGVQEIAGGSYAITCHCGPYERLGACYATLLGQWLPANNQQPKPAPCLEVYLNNPQQTAPQDLLTEIHIPLEAGRSTAR